MWFLLAACQGIPADAPPPRRVDAPELLAPTAMHERLFGAAERRRVINVWATWCAPCVEELPRLAAWSRANPDVEVVFVNVDLPVVRASRVVPFLGQHKLVDGLVHVQLDDPDPAMALRDVVPAWPDSVPVTLLVGESGSEVKRYTRSVTDADLTSWSDGGGRPGWWNR